MWALWAVTGGGGSSRASSGGSEDRAADEAAIRRIGAGDAEALAELYDRHGRPVFSLVTRIIHDQSDAEEVVQEVFSQAWRQASRFDGTRGAVGAWLLNMARSRAIDRFRSERARPDSASLPGDTDILNLPDGSSNQEALVLTRERVERVKAALAGLPFLQRLALELAYYDGLTQNEIAERLEQPLGTIKTRIRLGLLKLRDALAEVEP